MRGRTRARVFGGADLRASALALGLELVDRDEQLAIVDLRDAAACAAAANVPAAVARVVVAGDAERPLLDALGIDAARVASSCDVLAIGPLVAAAAPPRARSATRVVAVGAVRGGAGRTLLVANLARRLAARMSVCAVDLTGTGALGWWLECDTRPWSELEALRAELSADHLTVLATVAQAGVRVVGGPPAAPSVPLAAATIRVALALDDLVLVDAPLVTDPLFAAAAELADRVVVLAYEDAVSRATLAAAAPDDAWLVLSQSRAERIGDREVFRALPRDEDAVAAALARRGAVGGALGRAYDDLADLLAIDAS